MKIRVLYYSKKGKMETFSNAIGDALRRDSEGNTHDVKVDVIPPSFPCDKEKLVILGLSVGKDCDDILRRFCGELTQSRAKYVAMFIDSKDKTEPQGIKELRDAIKEAGATLLTDKFYFVDGGAPFKFVKKISMDERIAIVKWAEGLREIAKN